MQTKWELKTYQQAEADRLAKALSISELLAKLLVLRGMDNPQKAHDFLYLRDLKTLSSPHELSGMALLTQRVREAIEHQEKIMVYGDYDVDGICSVVILVECLRYLGADAEYRIPDRFAEGYGLNCQAVREMAEQHYRLILTVDCGITSIEEAILCKQLGIDLIITDHHNPGSELPEAFTIVNPKLDEQESAKNLAGAGVAFKTALALTENNLSPERFQEWMILASLATVADVVPLLAENRVLLKNGLRHMKQTCRPGLRKLFQMEGLLEQNLTTEKLAFQIIPKLNSAGRLETASISIQTLLTEDAEEAEASASYLLSLNHQRRQLEDEMLQQAIAVIEAQPEILEKPLLIVQGEEWNHGIVGILASRLVSKYHKPTLVISWSEGIGKGSGRSIEGVSLYDILAAGRSHLLRFGGHKMAAGLTVAQEDFPLFYQAVMQKADEIMREMSAERIYYLDAEVTLEQLMEEGQNVLESLEPMGEGNPSPLFLLRGAETEFYKRIGKKQEHVLCRIGKLEGIAFQQAERVRREQSVCRQDILFGLSEHEYMGVKRLQLMVKEFQPTAEYAEKVGKIPSSTVGKIRQITGELLQNRPVLLLYDDVRCLQKHRVNLQFYFQSHCFCVWHGELTSRERKAAELSWSRGEGKIFVVTYTVLHHWLKRNPFPSHLQQVYRCWNRPREAGALSFPEELHVQRWEESGTEAFGQQNTNPSGTARGMVYVNRPSTVQKISRKFPQHLSELQKEMSGRREARERWRQEESILLTDGVPWENDIADETVPDWAELADVPYTFGEVQFLWEAHLAERCRVSASFTREDVKNAQALLDKIYPEEETLFLNIKNFIWQILQINKTYHLAVEDFLRLYQEKKGAALTRMEAEGVFRIFSDLGLCEYRKKGSILTIKLLSNPFSMKKEDSFYFLEGRESKASLQYGLRQMAAILPKEKIE